MIISIDIQILINILIIDIYLLVINIKLNFDKSTIVIFLLNQLKLNITVLFNYLYFLADDI